MIIYDVFLGELNKYEINNICIGEDLIHSGNCYDLDCRSCKLAIFNKSGKVFNEFLLEYINRTRV